MKGGLCLIYTSLLTISVLSSCLLFILVVSEALHGEEPVGIPPDLQGLRNVSSQQPRPSSENEFKAESVEFKESKRPSLGEKELTFAEALSLNSVTTEGLPDTGQPPIIVSLADNIQLELGDPESLLFPNVSELHNDSASFILEGNLNDNKMDSKTGQVDGDLPDRILVVKAKPMQEGRLTDEAFAPEHPTPSPFELETSTNIEEANKSETNTSEISDTPQEDIPSFSEWAQKQIAEAEKQDTVLNHSSQPSQNNLNLSSKSNKLRTKNYASPACGAKIVAVNPEAGSASSILSPNRDEYMLNTCNSRIWFVVELCEPIQAQKIELANFELFSSTPKDIAVYFSDRFPTREWTNVGQFTAKDVREVQTFDLYPHLFGKFIKVEMLSHHGSEHYCPISQFKVYGTSEFEVLENEGSQHSLPEDDDDDDEILGDLPPDKGDNQDLSKNLFGSARDAVMSMMKKAAEVLVKSDVPKNLSSVENSKKAVERNCRSPSHIIVCNNCSESLYSEVYDLISCCSDRLSDLLKHIFVQDTFRHTDICQEFGLNFNSKRTKSFKKERADYLSLLFPKSYLGALCNILAIEDKKVVLNSSFETDKNITVNETETPSVVIDETIEVPIDSKANDAKIENSTEMDTSDTSVPDVVLSTTEKSMIHPLDHEDKLDAKAEEQVQTVDEKEQTKQDDVSPAEKQTGDKKSDAEDVSIQQDTIDEKVSFGVTNVGEEQEQVVIDADSYLSDFDQLATDPTPPGVVSTATQQPPKESVFLRLSNRVKTLERNMSLSGQYLEELSRRYKKQVEEMQKSFEKTVQQMNEERKKSNERELKYVEQLNNVQEQLVSLNLILNELTDSQNSWFGNITFAKLLIFQLLIAAAVYYFITTRQSPETVLVPIKKPQRSKKNKIRRKSVEGVSGHATPNPKTRRPSEEALRIARESAEEVDQDLEGEWQVASKNRRRKTSVMYGNNPIVNRMEWLRQDSIGVLQENAFPLEDAEFVAPVPEPKLNENVKDPKKEFPKTNGSIFGSFRNKSKGRRLSSPAFFRNALSRQSSRSIPTPMQSPELNGDVNRKAYSESPTGSVWSTSTEVQVNGKASESESSSVRSKKKSFKNIFRKVF